MSTGPNSSLDNSTSWLNVRTTELPVGPAGHAPDPLQPGDLLGVIVMSLLVIVTFNANLWIVVVITITPQLRGSLANIFIVNLCCVDLMASIVVMPLSLVTFVHGEDALGPTACNVSGYVSTCVMITSVLSLCVISMERYYTITLPMHHAGHATPCLYLVVVVTVWLISLFVAMFPLVGINSYKYRPSKRACVFYWQGGTSGDKSFIIVVFLISFLLPSIILLSMYIGIFRVAKKAATVIAPNGVPPARGAANSPQNGGDRIFAIHSCMGTTPQIKVQDVSVAGSSHCENRRMSAEDSGIRTADYTDSWSVQSFVADHSNQNNHSNDCENQESQHQHYKSHSSIPHWGRGHTTSQCLHDKPGNKEVVATKKRLNTVNSSNGQGVSGSCGQVTNITTNNEAVISDGLQQTNLGNIKYSCQTSPCNNGNYSCPNGSISCHNGTVSCHNGTISCPNGTVSCHNGTVSCLNGTVSCANGSYSCPDGTVSCPYGSYSCPNGSYSCPNGGYSFQGGTNSSHGGANSCNGSHNEPAANNHKSSFPKGHHHPMTNKSEHIFPCPNNNSDSRSVHPETPVISSQAPPPHRVKPSHMKAFKTLMIIVVSYLVQWTPYFACQLHGLLVGHSASDVLELVVHWVSLSSYALNPVLYGCMNRMIRDELTQLLMSLWNFCCCCVCVCYDKSGGVGRECHVSCRRPRDVTRVVDGQAEADMIGGAESFFQFLQRTEVSDHVQGHVSQDGGG